MNNFPLRPTTPTNDEDMLTALTESVVIAKSLKGTPLTAEEAVVAENILVMARFAEQLDGLTADDFAGGPTPGGIENDPED